MTQQSASAGKKVLIIGAGTAGMAAAITLSRIGLKVDLIDHSWRGITLIHCLRVEVVH